MDEQLYNELTQYLENLTYPNNITEQRKTHVRKIST